MVRRLRPIAAAAQRVNNVLKSSSDVRQSQRTRRRLGSGVHAFAMFAGVVEALGDGVGRHQFGQTV
jgi:hypothetical protein